VDRNSIHFLGLALNPRMMDRWAFHLESMKADEPPPGGTRTRWPSRPRRSVLRESTQLTWKTPFVTHCQAPGEVDKALGAGTSAPGTETRRQRPGQCLDAPPSWLAVPRLEDRVPGQCFRGPLFRLSVPKLDDRDLDQALAAAIAGLGTGTR
jgi:hypothetical protein